MQRKGRQGRKGREAIYIIALRAFVRRGWNWPKAEIHLGDL
jgi:hypothetical protein